MTEPAPLQQIDRTYVLFQGKRLSYFAGCDYLRMSSHPGVRLALERALRHAGLNVAASRLTTGNHKLYQQLEGSLRNFFSAPAATLVQTGYLTNFVAAQTFAGQFSHALVDAASHPALRDAAHFLNCPVLTFPSRSPDGLAQVLGRCGEGCRPIVLTDGMFSRDGSVAPLKEYLSILPSDAMLLVDDAHAAGVIGAKGRGSLEYCGVSRKRIVQTITLSKAFGVYGGAILSDQRFRAEILGKSSIFVGSTPLPLPLAAAASKSVQYVHAHPELRERMHRNADRLRRCLRQSGFDTPDTAGPAFGLIAKNERVAKRVTHRLLEAGIFPALIRYPGGPEGGLFRFVISSAHTMKQLDSLAAALGTFDSRELARA